MRRTVARALQVQELVVREDIWVRYWHANVIQCEKVNSPLYCVQLRKEIH